MARLRIGIVTPWDARTPAAASGTSYYMARALQRHVGDVTYLGPIRAWRELFGSAVNRLFRAISGGGRPYIHGRALAREYARKVRRRLPRDLDILFAPMASTQIAFLETDVPIAYTSDTTFRLLNEYYPEFAGLSARYVAEADESERLAIQRAKLIVYPSEYAARSALETYGAASDRVHVVSYGANLEEAPRREEIEGAKPMDRCRLVFLGKDWERKGGPIAYETVLELRRRGLESTLAIAGCSPRDSFAPGTVELVGWFNKADPVRRRALGALLLGANFLFQPTRYESLGLVYAEASAHGTPSIATDTGGVGGVITEGENGFRLPLTAGPREYADLIMRTLADQPGYLGLVRSTRRAYETRLNWDTWAQRMGRLFEQTIR